MSNAPASLNPTTASSTADSESGASPRLAGRLAFFLCLAGIGFAVDILTKWQVFAAYFSPPVQTEDGRLIPVPQEQIWAIPNVLGIETATNPGALFGMFAGYSWLFATLSFVALAGIVYWLFVKRAAVDGLLNFCLGLISGGILGNLYDRMGFGYSPGYPSGIRTHVRDWILFQWEGVAFLDPWPNFNIADSLLVCGAILLLIHAFFGGRPAAAKPDETTHSHP